MGFGLLMKLHPNTTRAEFRIAFETIRSADNGRVVQVDSITSRVESVYGFSASN